MGHAASVRTQSPVALAISSPTFLGDRPRGPILGARAEEAPTSPPVALKVLHTRSFSYLEYGGEYLTMRYEVGVGGRCCLHFLHLVGIKFGSYNTRSYQSNATCKYIEYIRIVKHDRCSNFP